ncbi:4Fe-4S binding protein [Candidatus Micrarchaeota archaeon]|nr:4Fe-4S binding protein [Candidatus Micrarchaeota archaeon]
MALALADLGRKVTYLDCDTDCPSAHILLSATLGKKQEVRSFIPAIDQDRCMKCGTCVAKCQFNALYMPRGKTPQTAQSLCSGCKACVLACPYGAISGSSKAIGWTYRSKKHGLELFSGKLKPSEPLSEKMVEAVKQRGFEEGRGEIFIVDTSAGAHCPVVRALEGCDRAFAVTEPTLFGESDLAAIEEVLGKLGIPHGVIVNRSTISSRKINGAALEIPYDRDMIDCYVLGVPIIRALPEHPLSRKISDFARRLLK